MRTVLYTYEFEPITVLELRQWHLHYLKTRGRVELAVFPPIEHVTELAEDAVPSNCYRVSIVAEPICLRGARFGGEQKHFLLFTRQEEVAMLLGSAFLPGQIKELREAEREAFSRGVLAAFDALSPGGN